MSLPPPLQNQGIEETKLSNEVKQKFYDLSTSQTTDIIKEFKKQITTESGFKTNSNSSLAADSSIWLIEACLNYDFDSETESAKTDEITYTFETEYSENVTQNSVLAVYNNFNQKISANLSDKTIKIIDLTAFTKNGKITYNAKIIFQESNLQKVSGLCDSYASSYSANWSTYWMQSYGGCLPLSTTNDGATACDAKLNCTTNIGCNGFYWSNVVTYNFYTSPSTTSLFSVHDWNPCQPLLSGTTLNSYISTCKTYANSNVPSSPASMQVSNYNVIDHYTLDQSNPSLLYFWWSLDVTYAKANCSGGGGERLVVK